MKMLFKYFMFITLLQQMVIAQYNNNDFSVSTNFNFNTTANIFLTPDADDILDQNNSFQIEDIYSYSIEIRYRVNEAIMLGLSAELMEASASGRNVVPRQFVVKDGFKLYPIEFSFYYFLPFSTEDFKFYLGGGLGVYTGKRTREFGNVNFVDVKSEIGYGIQVSTGMDYMIFDNLSVRGELRFRDPDFRITNKYNSTRGIYDGIQITLPDENITSKLNMDGITFRIGAVFHFSLFNNI